MRLRRPAAQPESDKEGALILLRRLIGDALRRHRLRQERTLRDVSAEARVSLGYLSEIERGQKEASSELLAAICDALGVHLSDVLREVSDELRVLEAAQMPSYEPDADGRRRERVTRRGGDGASVDDRLTAALTETLVAAANTDAVTHPDDDRPSPSDRLTVPV